MAWLLSVMTEFITFARAMVMQNFYEGKMFTKHPGFCGGKREIFFSLLFVRFTKGFPS